MGMVHTVCILHCQSPPEGESADTSRDQSTSQNKDSCHQRKQRCNLHPGPTLTFSLHPQPQARGGPVPTDHLSIYTHSLLLLFYRKMSPWSRRLMNSAESWSSPAPKSMTLKQLWNWPRNFDQRFQRQVMSPVAKKDRHWDPGDRGSHKQVSSWLPKLPLPSFLLHQVTPTPQPPEHLSMPHACSPKALWGPYHIQTLANPKSLGLARVSEFRIYYIYYTLHNYTIDYTYVLYIT